jgi:general secretion pathway protein H
MDLKKPRTLNLEHRTAFQAGFTLLEMAVVIVIISMAALLVIPLFPSTNAADLRMSARSLAAVIRYLGDRSVTTKTQYRLHLDVTGSNIAVRKSGNKEETAPDDPFLNRQILTDGVTLEDVEVPRLGKLARGDVAMDFGVAGLGEFTVIHLQGTKGNHLTITAFPNGGRVSVLDGYLEPDQVAKP